ncbi:hypothetical protein L3X38_014373 [Prunus dulcis]|uniref:Uncharacterized protein n=1 Tax=Prunus dulcis TaxID=3755 RepID=A0AAD4ZHX9_PRUDU|nr:hypothetical protein L3X38_014370 [Prunus dulcis]KAI5346494.1 hypothetical protein L3X38_014373 [Prunus dulcis]
MAMAMNVFLLTLELLTWCLRERLDVTLSAHRNEIVALLSRIVNKGKGFDTHPGSYCSTPMGGSCCATKAWCLGVHPCE